MSNTKVLEVSIKEYAQQRNKTVQAVYQQMKRKENAVALEGHVHVHRVGNKNIKFLDEVAVHVLDTSSSATPIVVVQEDLKMELATANDQIKMLEAQAWKQQGQIELLMQQLADRDKELRALAEPQSQIHALEDQIHDLSAERDKEKADRLAAEKTVQEANAEAWHHYRVALEIYNDLPWWKKRRRNAPVPPIEKE